MASGEKQVTMVKPRENSSITKENTTKYWGWKSMPYVIGNETFEKLGTTGTTANLLVYFTTVFHMESVAAATLLNIWTGTTNLATIVGAFVSDAHLGRYATLAFASVASFVGMLLLTLTSGIPSLHPPPTCHGGCKEAGATKGQMAFLLGALSFLVIGAGGIRPCNLAFGADQFDPKTEAGKRGINSFFNWYYFTFTVAMMVSSTIIIYVQSSVSWTIGLAIPAGLMFMSCVFFFVGTPMYVKVRPEGSPFTGILQVLVAAARRRGGQVTNGGLQYYDPPLESTLKTKLPRTHQFRVLDKAAIISNHENKMMMANNTNPWRLCSIQQIEEAKCLLRVIPIWIACTIYYTVTSQQSTYVVFQALQSNRRLSHRSSFLVPAGSFIVFTMLALSLWIPIYDRLLVPILRRRSGHKDGVSPLQRIGAGFFLSIITMLVSAVVEERRRSVALTHPTLGKAPSGGAVSAMSSMWLVPQLVLVGLSEAFSLIGQVEFYYKEFPENMRSVAGSAFFCGIAISHYLGGLMINVVHNMTGNQGHNWLAGDLNKGRLDYYYYLAACIGVINLGYFLVCAKWYRYKGEGDAAGHDEDQVAGGAEVELGGRGGGENVEGYV